MVMIDPYYEVIHVNAVYHNAAASSKITLVYSSYYYYFSVVKILRVKTKLNTVCGVSR